MSVERQVIAGDRDPGAERRSQAGGHRLGEGAREEVPEQPVEDEDELGAGVTRALEQLQMSGDAGHDLAHLRRAGDLEAVRAVVVEVAGFEQLVAEGDDLVAGGRHWPTLRCPAMDHSGQAAGRGEYIDSLMDTELYSIGAYFCDEHPELVDDVVAASAEIEGTGLESYARATDAELEQTFEVLLTGLAVRYYKAVAG